MPIQVKTMRNIWDKGKGKKEAKKYKILLPKGEENKSSSSPIELLRSKSEDKKENEVLFAFVVAREIEKYYLKHLARKKAFSDAKDEIVDAFAEYGKKLGEAGFSKI